MSLRPGHVALLLVAAMAVASCGNSGTATPTPGPVGRVIVNFNLDWRYQEGNLVGLEAPLLDDAGWAYVDLPHATRFVTPETPNAFLGISWYRKHFTVPAGIEGGKVFIEIGAAMQSVDVWVNGVSKVHHKGGYTPITVDLTDDVSYDGGDNVIALRVNSNASPEWAPGWNGVDFQYHGGLYRDVRMYATNRLHITDPVYANKVAGGGVFVTTPAVSDTAATVAIKTHLLNEAATPSGASVVSELVDLATGVMVGSATATASIPGGADAEIVQEIPVANPKLWHPTSPHLYLLRTVVKDGTRAVDEVTTRVGIRRITWSRDGGGLLINGGRVKLHGINRHQEIYGLGNAVPNRAIYYDIKRIKDGGMSYIRGSHYPQAPAFYDACDELGILVLNAQTGWQHFNESAAFQTNTRQELRDMIRRDRNHPSVVAWEASLNESSFTDAWAQDAHAIVHEEYPGDQAYSAAWMFSRADIFIGASQQGVRSLTDRRPIIISEHGDWDYGAAASTSRQPREGGDAAMLIQANNVEDSLNKNRALPWFTVDGYWDFADYAGFSNFGITRSGLVDMYRLPKHPYYFLQSQRDPANVLDGVDSGPSIYIANQWTPTSPTTVRVYGNCDQVSLFLNDTLVATRAPDAGTSLLHPPFNFELGAFTPGSLRADCLIGGAKVATFTRRTPGAAAAVRLRPEATTMDADASDARLVFVEVVDANGTVVPTDASAVTLAVSGPGSVVGPTTITMKGGQLATWVRGSRTAGTTTLTATAPSLSAATLDLESLAVPGLPPVPADRTGG